MKNDPKFKEMMDKELKKVYGSADGRSLNERMAARRAIFEALPEEDQLEYRKRAEKWKADAAKPERCCGHSFLAHWVLISFQCGHGVLDPRRSQCLG